MHGSPLGTGSRPSSRCGWADQRARSLASLGELLGRNPETVRQGLHHDGRGSTTATGALTVRRLTAIAASDYSDGAGKTSSSTVSGSWSSAASFSDWAAAVDPRIEARLSSTASRMASAVTRPDWFEAQPLRTRHLESMEPREIDDLGRNAKLQSEHGSADEIPDCAVGRKLSNDGRDGWQEVTSAIRDGPHGASHATSLSQVLSQLQLNRLYRCACDPHGSGRRPLRPCDGLRHVGGGVPQRVDERVRNALLGEYARPSRNLRVHGPRVYRQEHAVKLGCELCRRDEPDRS